MKKAFAILFLFILGLNVKAASFAEFKENNSLDIGSKIEAAKENKQQNLDFALIKAVKNNDVEKAKELLSYGANPNAKSGINESPLTMAIRAGKLDMVKILVDNGAVIYDKDVQLPMQLAVSASFYKKSILNYLINEQIKRRCKFQKANCPLDKLTIFDKKLLPYAVENSLSHIDYKEGEGYSTYSDDKNLEKVKMLVETAKLPIDWQDDNGNTALILAVQGNFYEVGEYLLEKGANPNLLNKEGHSALYYALSVEDELQCNMSDRRRIGCYNWSYLLHKHGATVAQ